MENLMKSFALCFMLCISTFVYGQTVTIGGEKHPVIGKTETYVVENHPRTSETEADWRIVGGSFSRGGQVLNKMLKKIK